MKKTIFAAIMIAMMLTVSCVSNETTTPTADSIQVDSNVVKTDSTVVVDSLKK